MTKSIVLHNYDSSNSIFHLKVVSKEKYMITGLCIDGLILLSKHKSLRKSQSFTLDFKFKILVKVSCSHAVEHQLYDY